MKKHKKSKKKEEKNENSLVSSLFVQVLFLFLICASVTCIIVAILDAVSGWEDDRLKNPQTYRVPKFIDLREEAKPAPQQRPKYNFEKNPSIPK